MDSEENRSPLADLRGATWDPRQEVEYDILTDLIRDAIGALTAMAHREREAADPRDDVIARIDERKTRLVRSLRDLRVFDADGAEADRLRAECLELIRGSEG
ncbi:hypothetical protein [Nocardiopsis sp. FIRDI 009]|uniref:hypothetical protein n=1 Tax=Nocardiopsis sp. FIRDI 009 TaxID=714197 RepID=UPI000E279658|nr:hypothetical protein [Nocardiopsis sp. FIRDI 009]